jgi:nitric oxide reductase subunit C
MNVPARKTLLIALVAVFVAQTWLVYSDPLGSRTQLSPAALAGRALWHRHNCQSCHQLYGFGGFLGPDLTNVATRLGGGDDAALAQRLTTILTNGSERMPAFRLGEEQRGALAAFFVELDASGVGQARVAAARPPRQLFAETVTNALAGTELDPAERRGFELAQEHGCIDCHLPNESSPLRAPDLTAVHSLRGPARLREVLAAGLPQKGMPDFGLSEADIESIVSFLARLDEVGSEVARNYAASVRAAGGSLFDLPWFDYAR